MWLDRPKQICDKKNWFPVWHRLIDRQAKQVGIGPFAVYICLLRHRNCKKDYSYPSQRLASSKLGIDKKTLREHIAVLVENNWIQRIKKKRRGGRFPQNIYYFVHPSEWLMPGTWQIRKSKDKSPPRGESPSGPGESLPTKKINNKKKINIGELRRELATNLTYKHENYYKNK